MTGYGRAEVRTKHVVASAEVRGVNSRFLEVGVRLPSGISHRESEVKETVRTKVSRGKVNVVITLERLDANEIPLRINKQAAKAYYELLGELRKTLKLKDSISIGHLLKFSEVFEPFNNGEASREEWRTAERALTRALDDFNQMRRKEGDELMRDVRARIKVLGEHLTEIEKLSKQQIPDQRARLEKRIEELVSDKGVVDANRLELEIALLADKLDVTEECVRFRSHNKLFLESLGDAEAAGRKLNFLIQEMNREVNTIGSKAADARIAHIVVDVKEELEKIREQLQNIE